MLFLFEINCISLTGGIPFDQNTCNRAYVSISDRGVGSKEVFRNMANFAPFLHFGSRPSYAISSSSIEFVSISIFINVVILVK